MGCQQDAKMLIRRYAAAAGKANIADDGAYDDDTTLAGWLIKIRRCRSWATPPAEAADIFATLPLLAEIR